MESFWNDLILTSRGWRSDDDINWGYRPVPYIKSEPEIGAEFNKMDALISNKLSIKVSDGRKIIMAGYQLDN